MQLISFFIPPPPSAVTPSNLIGFPVAESSFPSGSSRFTDSFLTIAATYPQSWQENSGTGGGFLAFVKYTISGVFQHVFHIHDIA